MYLFDNFKLLKYLLCSNIYILNLLNVFNIIVLQCYSVPFRLDSNSPFQVPGTQPFKTLILHPRLRTSRILPLFFIIAS